MWVLCLGVSPPLGRTGSARMASLIPKPDRQTSEHHRGRDHRMSTHLEEVLQLVIESISVLLDESRDLVCHIACAEIDG